MKIRLSDRAGLCFLCARESHVVEALRNRCIKQKHLLAIHPLYLLLFILEERTAVYNAWLQKLYIDAFEIEAVTEMAPPTWKSAVMETKKNQLADFDEVLKRLHSVSAELSHSNTVMRFAVKFGHFCLRTIDTVENLCAELDLEALKRQHRSQLNDCVRFVHDRNEFRKDKLDEVLYRLERQINVVRSSLTAPCKIAGIVPLISSLLEQIFSLVTQRDSKVNLAVAEDSNYVALLAAQDSETMKTITVLTLVFLPSSLVTVRSTALNSPILPPQLINCHTSLYGVLG